MGRSARTIETAGSEAARRDFQIEQWMKEVHTALPVRVLEAFPQEPGDAGGDKAGFVHVELMIDQMDNEDRKIDTRTLYNLPYLRAQGGVCAFVVDPEPGDLGFAVFCERDISIFKRTLEKCLPDSLRMFSQSDGIYVGGILNKPPKLYVHIHPEKGVIVETDEKNLTLRCGGDCDVAIQGRQTINCDLTDHSGNIVIDGISFVDHVHTGVMPGGGLTGTPAR